MNLKTKLEIDEKVQAVLSAREAERAARAPLESEDSDVLLDDNEEAMMAYGAAMQRRVDAEMDLIMFLRGLE